MPSQPLKYLFLWLFPLLLSANFVKWLGSYDLAHQKALKEQKPLLVFVVKKNDPLSSRIVKNSFMNKKYMDLINEKMVPVIVTYEGTLSYPIEMYYSTKFPTLFLVDSGREVCLKPPFNTIKLSILKKFGAGTLVPFYGTEVPTPCGKKWLSLMTLKPPLYGDEINEATVVELLLY